MKRDCNELYRLDASEGPAQRRVRQRMERVQETKAFMRKVVLDDLYSNDTAVLQRALSMLADDLYTGKDYERRAENQDAFFQVGGHLAVVKVMNAHYCPEIQKQGLRVLINATCDHPELQTAVAEVGGMLAILDAMNKHPLDGKIQRNGLHALVNLVSKDEENAELLVTHHDAARFICNTINNFMEDNRRVVAEGCMLLHVLCSIDHLRQPLFHAKALSLLAIAIETHGDDVQCPGQEAMRLLLRDMER